MKLFKSLGLATLMAAALSSSMVTAAEKVNSAIANKLNMLGLQATEMQQSKIPGLKEVFTDRGIFYVSEDGQYMLHGRMFELGEQVVNLTEEALGKMRLAGVDKYKDSMIVFPAKNEKHRITVFTDTTCGYCRKLHNEMANYNELGITVQYLAFPREGISSNSFKSLQNVWCADDKKAAMTSFQSGLSIESKSCSTKVAQHYDFGQAVGVTGTPAIILNDGSMILSYTTPEQLIKRLSVQ